MGISSWKMNQPRRLNYDKRMFAFAKSRLMMVQDIKLHIRRLFILSLVFKYECR